MPQGDLAGQAGRGLGRGRPRLGAAEAASLGAALGAVLAAPLRAGGGHDDQPLQQAPRTAGVASSLACCSSLLVIGSRSPFSRWSAGGAGDRAGGPAFDRPDRRRGGTFVARPVSLDRRVDRQWSAPATSLPLRRRRSGRAAHDEARLEPPVLGVGLIPSLHDGQEQADRLGALATDRLMDRRERGIHVRGEVDVVEPDDADVAGNGQAAGRAGRASRRSPSRRSSPGRRSAGRPSSQAPFEGGDAAVDAGRADHDALVRDVARRWPRTPRGSRAAGGW